MKLKSGEVVLTPAKVNLCLKALHLASKYEEDFARVFLSNTKEYKKAMKSAACYRKYKNELAKAAGVVMGKNPLQRAIDEAGDIDLEGLKKIYNSELRKEK